MKDQSFLDELRESIIAKSEHEIYFRDEAGGSTLLYYDLSAADLKRYLTRALKVDSMLTARHAKRRGIAEADAEQELTANHAAIIEETLRETQSGLRDAVEEAVRQAMQDYWFGVISAALNKSIARRAGKAKRATDAGMIAVEYRRGVVEKKSIGKAGPPKGPRLARTTSEPKNLDEFYRRLEKLAKSYEGEFSKRLTAPIAAKRLGFGSERTMRRRLRDRGEDRRFTDLLDDLLN
jgi:hypothetical protein